MRFAYFWAPDGDHPAMRVLASLALVLASALPALDRMWRQGMCFSVDLLGEACVSDEEARLYRQKYLDLVENLPKRVAAWPAKPVLESDHLGPVARTNVSIKISSLSARVDPIDTDGSVRALMAEIRPILEAAKRNVADPRAEIRWADVRATGVTPASLDFVVMNPPFHDAGTEDRQLGQTFIRQAASLLRKGGTLWLVANRHLPYEALLTELFRTATPRVDQGGFKVIEAVK